MTKVAYLLEEHGYLNPPDEWVSVHFNGPGDLMWVSGQDGYQIFEMTPNRDEPIEVSNEPSVSVRVQDRLQNRISIKCRLKAR